MAQLTAEQAFNQLERNADSFKKDSLDGTEKAALKSVKLEDIKAAKDTLGKRVFTINSKSKFLSDIVKNFDTQTNEVEYSNGSREKVEKNSDLAAAIQFYLIANGKDIRTNKQMNAGAKVTNGIDGDIGEVTKDKITELQNDMKKKEKKGNDDEIERKTEKYSIVELTTKSFKKYVSVDKLQVLYNHGIMDPNTYTLTPTNKSTYAADKKLKFEYKYNGKTLKIEVKINEDQNGEVDPKKLVEDLLKACNSKENDRDTEVKNQTAEGGIENFSESKITNPVVKEWAKDINFRATADNKGNITIKDKSGKNITKQGNKYLSSFTIANSDVLTNGKFDATKFDKLITKNCYPVALDKVKLNLTNSKKGIDTLPVTGPSQARKQVTAYKDLLVDIDNYRTSDLNGIKSNVENAKDVAEAREYVWGQLEKMDADIKILNSLNGVLTKANKEKVINTMSKYFKLTKTGTGKYDYTYKLEDNPAYLSKVKKADLTPKYNYRKKTMVDIADKYEIEINQ